jgi:hypothetical protein
MNQPSAALRHKIAAARAKATAELPLVRDCARVVLQAVSADGPIKSEYKEALDALKASHGAHWSLTTALQLLSGRRGKFAAEAASGGERVALFLAHLVAKSVSSQGGLGAVSKPTQAEMDEMQILAERYAQGLFPPQEQA